MVARISPEGESPPLPATSPKLLSRQGTPSESSETVYTVVCPNVSPQVTTPAVTAKITVTTLVILILFLLNCGKTGLIMRSISNVVGVGVGVHVGVSGVGRGTHNIRIGRIATAVVSTNPVVICSRGPESGIRKYGDICAYSRNSLKLPTMMKAVDVKPGFVVRIIGPGQVDLAR